MKCMILAAGLGTRLLPLTLCRAKAAVPYHNRPLICRCLDRLTEAGVDQVVINLHHLPQSVRQAVAEGDWSSSRIQYSYEPEILGTAGALNPVRDWLGRDPFLLVNGKIVFDFDLHDAVENHRRSGALATLVLVDRVAGEDFNPVFVNAQGAVTGFARSSEERALPGLVFTGIQVLAPGIWRYVPGSGFSDIVRDVYCSALNRGERIAAYHARGSWLELSTLTRYWRLNVKTHGNHVGQGSTVSRSAELINTVVWNGVRIGDGCMLENCIVVDGVNLPPGAKIKNAAIVSAQLATPPFQKYIDGELILYPLGSRD